jgi:hypothetical protein
MMRVLRVNSKRTVNRSQSRPLIIYVYQNLIERFVHCFQKRQFPKTVKNGFVRPSRVLSVSVLPGHGRDLRDDGGGHFLASHSTQDASPGFQRANEER